jgi:beta-lactamase regulating signal transducer with metallopeptidase domain
MFALRGIAVSLSVFVLVYIALSVEICLVWRSLSAHFRGSSARRIADLLFTLRLFPLVSATIVTAVLTVPSFLLFEPRGIDEPVGEIPLALTLCGVALGIFGIVNAGLAMSKASRAISGWARDAQPIETGSIEIGPIEAESMRIKREPVLVLRIAQSAPAMIAAGIAHPMVLVSGAAESQLSIRELRSALKHEVAHVRRRDNLKKLVLRFVVFPGMAALESAWLEATEMAADDAAVSNAGEALDLAAALIKLSRLGPVESPLNLAAALAHSPTSMVNARVERLIEWNDERLEPESRHRSWPDVVAMTATVSAMAAAFAVIYLQLLAHIHTATEWMVR